MLSKVSTMSRLSMFHGRKGSHSISKRNSNAMNSPAAFNSLYERDDVSSTNGQKIPVRNPRKAVSVIKNNGINVTVNPITGHTQKFIHPAAPTNGATGTDEPVTVGMQTGDVDFDPITVGDLGEPLASQRYKQKR